MKDKTIRIWHLTSQKCSKVCIPSKRYFDVSTGTAPTVESDVEMEILAVAFLEDELLVASVGATLLLFNISGDEVVISKTLAELHVEAGDINTIEVVSGTSTTLLCGCDDGIVEIEMVKGDGSVSMSKKSQMDAHAGAFVSVAKPLPSDDGLSYVSGGFDCKVVRTNRVTEAVSFDLSTQEVTSGNVKQMFNPPYVYTLDVLGSGPWVIAGTGSGNLESLNVELKVRADPIEAHSSAINFLSFARFELSGASNLLVSTGSDGFIAFRTVEAPNNANALKYSEILQRQTELQSRIAGAKKASKPQLKLLSTFSAQLKQLDGVPKLNLIHKVKHPNVVNWFCTSSKPSECGNMYVADTTNTITCYKVATEP